MQDKENLTVAEVTRRLGISRKTLRLFEAQGLVDPPRTLAGWRVYGAQDVARLHQILALRNFGFPLTRVAQILHAEKIDIEKVLSIQEEAVERQVRVACHAAHLLKAARRKLASAGYLSMDDLIFLTRETVMNDGAGRALENVYADIAAKHLSDSERQRLCHNGRPTLLQSDSEWSQLHDEAGRLMLAGDPKSLAAMDLARRWMTKVLESTGGDRDLTEKLRRVARDIHAEPEFQHASTSSNEMMDFVQQAYRAAIEAGLMPKP